MDVASVEEPRAVVEVGKVQVGRDKICCFYHMLLPDLSSKRCQYRLMVHVESGFLNLMEAGVRIREGE